MLKEDPKFAFRDLAWSQTGMMELFNASVLPLAWPGREAASVAIERVKYKPGKSNIALYRLGVCGRSEEPALRAVVAFANSASKARLLEERHRNHYAGWAASRPGRPRVPAVFLPEFGCMIEFFPNDWKLPSLAQILTESDQVPRPAEVVGSRVDFHDPRVKVEVLKYHPHGRCVVQISVEPRNGEGQRELIGKVLRDAATAREMFRKQRSLHLQAAAQGLMIPRPLETVDDLNLLVMEHCAGSTMSWRHQDAMGEWEPEDEVRAAAAALATFHGLELEGGEVRTLRTEWSNVSRRVDRINLVAPELSRMIAPLLTRIEPMIDQSDAAARCSIHADFKRLNLLLNKDRIVVLDVDHACLGDPALDVGGIMATFYKEARQTGDERQRQFAREFLVAYQERAPYCDGLARRARVFQALALMRYVSYLVTRYPHKCARSTQLWRLALLEDAAACLDSIEGT